MMLFSLPIIVYLLVLINFKKRFLHYMQKRKQKDISIIYIIFYIIKYKNGEIIFLAGIKLAKIRFFFFFFFKGNCAIFYISSYLNALLEDAFF
ncbi:hypothetical protein O3M35_005345 [Rhynocoris fuscipes]|uniref:Uncharacterized protein n=1 Tax=Rhynocoris fuscipes TaxID=488301 RepID=A0AAW1DK57_9HEMI